MSPESASLVEVLTRRAGVVNAGRLLTFFVCWGAARAEIGDDMTPTQFAEDGGYFSRRTAFRRLDMWREVVPEFDTPTEYLDMLAEQGSVKLGSEVVHA